MPTSNINYSICLAIVPSECLQMDFSHPPPPRFSFTKKLLLQTTIIIGGPISTTTPIFTHGPWRWNHGSSDRLSPLLLLLLLLLQTTNFLFLLGTENTNFQTGLTFQATPVTPMSSCSFSFYFLEFFLSGELSTPVRRTVHRLQAVQ